MSACLLQRKVVYTLPLNTHVFILALQMAFWRVSGSTKLSPQLVLEPHMLPGASGYSVAVLLGSTMLLAQLVLEPHRSIPVSE